MPGKLLLKGALTVVFALGMVACGGDDGGGSSDPGYFRFVNLSANSPTIELEMDENSYSKRDFGESSSLASMDADTYELSFNQLLPNTEDDQFVSDSDITVSQNEILTYIVYGDVNSIEKLTITTYVEDIFDDDYDLDLGRLQFVHLAPELGDVDIYLVDAGDDLLNQSSELFLSYGDVSDAADFDIGDYKIIVTAANSQTILLESDNIDIDYGESYIYCLVEVESVTSDQPHYSLVELDEGASRVYANDAEPAHIRFNNAIADIDAVDIYLDAVTGEEANLVFAGVEFGDISGEARIDIKDVDRGDSHELYITAAGSTETLESFDIDVDTDSQMLITAAGLIYGTSSERVRLNTVSEDLRAIDTHAKLIFTHAIGQERDDSLEFLVVEHGDDPDSFSPQITIGYLSSKEYEIERGDYDVYVYNADTGSLLLERELNGLDKGDVINLTATEAEGGSTPYQLKEVEN
ncbi:DUF4397 domain-containing protein [Halioxenophilus sp. WMMB6]|uniref:DUF4397 domain-containing protein n=1 Tax=Halioxenophilus sp. WMMB6 TaxID=3073815 RepID=UPI00295EA8B3|nr:DUF4397 domain-containing protein [Halioxenophilus sp. WMMB6]